MVDILHSEGRRRYQSWINHPRCLPIHQPPSGRGCSPASLLSLSLLFSLCLSHKRKHQKFQFPPPGPPYVRPCDNFLRHRVSRLLISVRDPRTDRQAERVGKKTLTYLLLYHIQDCRSSSTLSTIFFYNLSASSSELSFQNSSSFSHLCTHELPFPNQSCKESAIRSVAAGCCP